MPELYDCEHPGKIGRICVNCCRKLCYCISLGYIPKNCLRDLVDNLLRLRANYTNNLLHRKKLCLVLDLDHTLLNSSPFNSITSPEKEYFDSSFPEGLFRINSIERMTKLRPFVHTFLKEASSLYEMCIYTMAERCYALQMVKLLDPEKIYFKSRIISRGNSTVDKRKGLDVVLGQEKIVIIVDDKKHVWEKQEGNLIGIGRYDYFASSCKKLGLGRKSFAEKRCDESDSDGPLADVLETLRGVHGLFFDEESKVSLGDRDVREVLKIFKEKQTFARKRKRRSSSI